MIHILDEVPRTATGKLQRRRIAARFVETLSVRGRRCGRDRRVRRRRARPRRRRRDPDRERSSPPRHAGARRARAEPPRRLPRRHRARRTTSTRSATPTSIFLALKAHSLPDAAPTGSAPRWRRARRSSPRRTASRGGTSVAAGRSTSWLRASTPAAGSRRRSLSSSVDRLRHLLLDGDRRAGRHPPHRGDALRARRAGRRGERALPARSRRRSGPAACKCPVETDLRDQIWLKLIGNVAFNAVSALTGATLGELGERAGDGRACCAR